MSALCQKPTYVNTSVAEVFKDLSDRVSHTGQSKVRLSLPGLSGSIRASHIGEPHFGQSGSESTRRFGSKL